MPLLARWRGLGVVLLGLALVPGCFLDWDAYQGSSVCPQAWSPPELVLYAPFDVAGLAVAQDGRELLFLRVDDTDPSEFWQATRSSPDQPFLQGARASELTALCAGTPGPAGIDVTADGLRAYVTCIGPNPLEPGPVKLASRASLDAPFEAAAEDVGESFSAVRVSADELVMYSSAHPLGGVPLQASRAAASGPFGSPTGIPGLDLVPLESPAPSRDGLTLFGTLTDAATQLGRVTRPDAAGGFAGFTALYTGLDHVGVPAVQSDCGAIYFLAGGVGSGTTAASREIYATRGQ